ncbi:16S rRNA (cytidine(1402)-2'-O)-methyltransferase [Cryptosporangium aurantiacum]|uniref:Ribosomal RNA small subunit methyltransferase I n=1 Tax=Cryptosporangium aurantiacum TaxID=134849 RepID=A0A1M7RJP9_9ACTN|nr:16S rRNA (cytidine(1402)-2'-O)-methyltransferase [Cryptosporangium aurantiacum]SHN46392.1 16S rRNA (cytidine1402-2'-O)-methyltransferase [Cryptosporangium aurantiacum]
MSAQGRVILAGVPLGNSGDATDRLKEALATADVIAAEDTRRARRLASDLGVTVTGQIVRYDDVTEQRQTDGLRDRAAAGATVLLITDGGMPSVSDPGYRLVTAAIAADIPVAVLPGPSAVTTALTLSGLPSDRFCFEGFLPSAPGKRKSAYAALAAEQRTMVFFESPRRIGSSLVDAAAAFGADRPAAVCRELTKTHEEVRRGTLGALAEWAKDGLLGEVTVVISGAPPPRPEDAPDAAELARRVALAEASGVPRKEAMRAVAAAVGVPKSVVYDAVTAAKNDPSVRNT